MHESQVFVGSIGTIYRWTESSRAKYASQATIELKEGLLLLFMGLGFLYAINLPSLELK